ncbi:hypothetical protein CH92_09340 [Stutzerimonas stutzeri]|uniref:Quinol:cytochrome c oxidoreductase quinone-binding subunit 2 n=1 Tax=Stutzerimonas stutzeri TaxID=316 RepID=W8R3X8_STUST|nr:hypothetical protein [Stutzerimonas stutzeri]AHL77625.1 hypothetical protein CH92_09340 [Stutzerimonas stutzeri]MCQ4328142.1 hypothetical protein [Stutzerimonas stutzeri]
MTARRWAWVGAGLGALGLLACLLLASREAVAASLASLLGLAGMPLGGLCLGLSVALVSGNARDQLWPWALFSARALPVLALIALPVLMGVGTLYEWVGHDEGGFRGFWLAWPSFVVRAVLYLATWWVLARWVLPLSIRRPAAAGLGLIVLVLTTSLAAMDWAMSLDPQFKSSLFGMVWFGRLMLTGVAFCCLFALGRGTDRPGVLRGMLAAAALAWLYLHFMQYLVIWYGNLPEEIRWYQHRAESGWLWLTWALGAGQSLVFLALLWPFSQTRGALTVLAAATLVLGLVEGVWLSLPGLSEMHPMLLLLSLSCAWLFGVGLLALALLSRKTMPGRTL